MKKLKGLIFKILVFLCLQFLKVESYIKKKFTVDYFLELGETILRRLFYLLIIIITIIIAIINVFFRN